MRFFLRNMARILGSFGVLFCIGAIILGWIVANRVIDRANPIVQKLEVNLSKTEKRLSRIGARLGGIRGELNSVRIEAAQLQIDHPGPGLLQTEVDRLAKRLIPVLQLFESASDSLSSIASGLSSLADMIEQCESDSRFADRVRSGAESLETGATFFDGSQDKLASIRLAPAGRLKNELVAFALEAAAESDRIMDGITAAQLNTAQLRDRVLAARNTFFSRMRYGAILHSAAWIWLGLGQLCLIGRGCRSCPTDQSFTNSNANRDQVSN